MRLDENDWIDDVKNNIDHRNDNLKPHIATLRFDNNQSFINYEDENLLQSFNCCDEEGIPLDPATISTNCDTASDYDDYISGEVFGDLTTNIAPTTTIHPPLDFNNVPPQSPTHNPSTNDCSASTLPSPTYNQSTTDCPTSTLPSILPNSTSWTPTLLPIKEETTNDLRVIRNFNDDGIWRIKRRTKDRYNKLTNKINQMIKQSDGLYRV